MDAGVPMNAAVAGIAMGLVKSGDRAVVMTDIAGAEDHHGDMDFKVAGTTAGITGLQMDIKITGITREIMAQALAQARDARMSILKTMHDALEKPRADISPYAPRILTIQVNKDKIRDIIGPGGKMIRSIVERTGCKIEVHDDGRVVIASHDEAAAQQAVDIIKELTAEAELGKTYMGKVVRVVNFGCFVEILPGVEGLVHISELAEERIGEVRDVVDEGDEILVKVIDIDALGRVRLSRRAVLREKSRRDSPEPTAAGTRPGRGPQRGPQPEERQRGGRGRDRGRDDR